MLPAARKGDPVACVAHGVQSVQGPCFPRVLIGNAPAARQNDLTDCGDAIVRGCPTVLIGNAPAARVTDHVAGGGEVVSGCLRVLIGNPPVDANGAVVPVAPACSYLKDIMRDPPEADLARYRSKPAISEPRRGTWKMPGDKEPSATREYQVTVRGHTVTVVEPAAGAPPESHVPNAETIAKALAVLPQATLDGIHTVVISPNPYSDEAGKDDGRPADNGGGRVTFYPRSEDKPQSNADWILIHESGHNVTQGGWQKDPALQREWEAAIKSDVRWASNYARTNSAEDFCESLVMYALSKGTACEAAARAMYPARYAILDRVYGPDLGRRNR